jgi:hypothetical protein
MNSTRANSLLCLVVVCPVHGGETVLVVGDNNGLCTYGLSIKCLERELARVTVL